MPLTLRSVKGSALSHAEMDGNFTHLGLPTETALSAANPIVWNVGNARHATFTGNGTRDLNATNIPDAGLAMLRLIASGGDLEVTLDSGFEDTEVLSLSSGESSAPLVFARASGSTIQRLANVADIITNVGDAEPSVVVTTGSPHVLSLTERAAYNVRLHPHQASVVFQYPASAPAGSIWHILAKDASSGSSYASCSVEAQGAGTTQPSPATIDSGGEVFVSVAGQPGSNPVVTVRGDLLAGTPVDFGGTLVSGARRAHVSRGAGSVQPNADANDSDSGKSILSDGLITIPNVAGWNCLLRVGANTHDWRFNDGALKTFDISAAGIAAGARFFIEVNPVNTLVAIGAGAQYTEANFS